MSSSARAGAGGGASSAPPRGSLRERLAKDVKNTVVDKASKRVKTKPAPSKSRAILEGTDTAANIAFINSEADKGSGKGKRTRELMINDAPKYAGSVEELWHHCAGLFYDEIETLKCLETYSTSVPQLNSICDFIKTQTARNPWTIEQDPTEFYSTWCGGLSPTAAGCPIRDLFEPLAASKQCIYAERVCKKPTIWNKCYICGESIYVAGLDSPECEHIIDAFTSIGYHGLITSAATLTQADINYYRYEYAYAHRCCNQVKTDRKWIKYNKDARRFEIDAINLQLTLSLIWSNTNYDCRTVHGLFKKAGVTKASFIASRSEYISRTYLIPLTEMINRDHKSKGDAYFGLMRVRQLNGLGLSVRNIIDTILTGETTRTVALPKEKEYTPANKIIIQRMIDQTLSRCSNEYVAILLRKLIIFTSPNECTVTEDPKIEKADKAVLNAMELILGSPKKRMSARAPIGEKLKTCVENGEMGLLITRAKTIAGTKIMKEIGESITESKLNYNIEREMNTILDIMRKDIDERISAVDGKEVSEKSTAILESYEKSVKSGASGGAGAPAPPESSPPDVTPTILKEFYSIQAGGYHMVGGGLDYTPGVYEDATLTREDHTIVNDALDYIMPFYTYLTHYERIVKPTIYRDDSRKTAGTGEALLKYRFSLIDEEPATLEIFTDGDGDEYIKLPQEHGYIQVPIIRRLGIQYLNINGDSIKIDPHAGRSSGGYRRKLTRRRKFKKRLSRRRR